MTPEQIEERRQQIRLKRGLTDNLRTGSKAEDVFAGLANNLLGTAKAIDAGGNPNTILRHLSGGDKFNIPTPMEAAFKLVTKKNLPNEDAYSLLGMKNEPATNFMNNPDVHPTTGGKFQLAGELMPLPQTGGTALKSIGMQGAKDLAGIVPSMIKGGKKLAEEGLSSLFRNDEQALKNLGNLTESDIRKSLSKTDALNPKDAFDIAKQRHDIHKEKVDNAWDVLRGYGEMADYEPTVKFNNKSYLDAVQNKINELEKLSRHPANADKYASDIDFLRRTLTAPTDTFKNAFEHGKSLNSAFRSHVQPGQPVPPSFETVNFLKKAHDKNIMENISKNNLTDTLGDIFNNARSSTKELHDIYYRKPTETGREGKTAFSNLVKRGSETGNPEDFMNDFIPSSKSTGIGRFKQLEKMLDSPEEARKLILSTHFNLGGNASPNMSRFLTKFESLSPAQREYLFPRNVRQKLELMSNIKQKNPSLLDTEHAGITWKQIIPTLLGAMSTHNPVVGGVAGKVIGDVAKDIGTRISQGNLRDPANVAKLLQRVGLGDLPQANLANTTNITDQAISLNLKKAMKGKKK